MKLLLVDASSIIYRAVYAPTRLNGPSGEETAGVFIFVKTLVALLRELEPTHIAFALDGPRNGSVRRELFPAYKANRKDKLTPEERENLEAQLKRCLELVDLFGVVTFEAPRWEADDVIASLVERFRGEVPIVIVSGDKDLGQLVQPNVDLYDPFKKALLGPAEIEERWGVPPSLVPQVQALAGDSSDGVPGAPGIGPVKAAKLVLAAQGNFEAIRAGQIPGATEKQLEALAATDLELMLKLVTLSTKLRFSVELAELERSELDFRRAAPVLRGLGFRSVFETQKAAFS